MRSSRPQVLSSSSAALGALMQRHYPSVRTFVRLRMSPLLRAYESADDLVQSTCGELLRCADGKTTRLLS